MKVVTLSEIKEMVEAHKLGWLIRTNIHGRKDPRAYFANVWDMEFDAAPGAGGRNHHAYADSPESALLAALHGFIEA